jgi:hypothetical protein
LNALRWLILFVSATVVAYLLLSTLLKPAPKRDLVEYRKSL